MMTDAALERRDQYSTVIRVSFRWGLTAKVENYVVQRSRPPPLEVWHDNDHFKKCRSDIGNVVSSLVHPVQYAMYF
jgi:hypothetical protein